MTTHADIIRPAGASGQLAIRVVAMPANTNQNGDIFGGWIMSQMDIAGGVFARHTVGARVVTVAVEALTFHKPVKIGDELSCYTKIVRQGRTSITIRIQTWVRRFHVPQIPGVPDDGKASQAEFLLVTEGNYIYVAIDANGRPCEFRHVDLDGE